MKKVLAMVAFVMLSVIVYAFNDKPDANQGKKEGDFYVDEGSIALDGQDITYLPAHKRSRQIGRLFQDPMRGTAPHMTIEENLALAAGSGGWFSPMTKAPPRARRPPTGPRS